MDSFGLEIPVESRYAMIKAAGFAGIQMCRFSDFENEEYNLRPSVAKSHFLTVENIHAPFRDVNTLWLPGTAGDNYAGLLCKCAEFCARNEIPAVVIHLSDGALPPEKTMLGWSRLETAIQVAHRWGIRFFVENLCTVDNGIKMFLEQFAEYQPGFCYDTGHDHCYTPEYDWLGHFGKKLASLHLSDNDGKTDSHALPFDGTFPWESLSGVLNEHQSLALTLEVSIKTYENHYKDVFTFLEEAYKRVKRIDDLLFKQEKKDNHG
jgi:sugar phosphate isomerase/epimerase